MSKISIILVLICMMVVGVILYSFYAKPRGQINAPYDLLNKTCKLSSLSYIEPEDFKIQFKGLCDPKAQACNFKSVSFFNDTLTDSQAYLFREDDTIYLTFRGTEHSKDVAAGLDVILEDLGHGISVHQGVYKQFCSIEDGITEVINDNLDIESLVITGHSLGGGLASLATYHYSKLYPGLNIQTVTFGSLRVGNFKFANLPCHKNGYRVFNYKDPVPMFPMSRRFNHVAGTDLCITPGACQISSAEQYTSLRFPGLLKLGMNMSIVDHYIDTYASILSKFSVK